MSWGDPETILLIIAISTLGWVAHNWIRARHGYALEDEWGGKTVRHDGETTRKLTAENDRLRKKLAKTEAIVEVGRQGDDPVEDIGGNLARQAPPSGLDPHLAQGPALALGVKP